MSCYDHYKQQFYKDLEQYLACGKQYMAFVFWVFLVMVCQMNVGCVPFTEPEELDQTMVLNFFKIENNFRE